VGTGAPTHPRYYAATCSLPNYHLLLARDLEYIAPSRYEQLARETQEIAKMLATFIDRLR
jgi:four helix bundle protein